MKNYECQPFCTALWFSHKLSVEPQNLRSKGMYLAVGRWLCRCAIKKLLTHTLMSASVDIVSTLLAWGCSSSFSGPEHSTVSQSRVTKCWDARIRITIQISEPEIRITIKIITRIYSQAKTVNETQQILQSSMIAVCLDVRLLLLLPRVVHRICGMLLRRSHPASLISPWTNHLVLQYDTIEDFNVDAKAQYSA